MATITSSEINIYTDSAGTTQLGSTITTSSSSTAIAFNSTTVGATVSPGKAYYAKARCTNSDSYTSEWTALYPFKTLILADLTSVSSTNTTIDYVGALTYTAADITPTTCGIKYSTSADGSNPVTTSIDEQEFGQGATVTGLAENTKYYVVPYVTDSDGRTYTGDWATAEQITTGYNKPTVTISNVSTTYNSISGTVNVTSTSSLVAPCTVSILESGGTDSFTLDLITTTGEQTFTFTNGSNDKDNHVISISPNTVYTITAIGTNSGGSTTATTTATTAQQSTSTISITSVSDITPTSATINLSFGSGS